MGFDFSQDYILEDGLVRLRPLCNDDVEHLAAFSLHQPEIFKYSSVPVAGKENLENYIQKAVANREKNTEYAFIAFDKRTDEYAGSTRFYDIQLNHKTLQLGYTWYGKQFHGTGLNKHCKFLLLQFAFETMGMERVEFRADNENARSIAAMKSIGCKVDGILRSNLIKLDGGRRDSIVLSILKEEWLKSAKDDLQTKLNWP